VIEIAITWRKMMRWVIDLKRNITEPVVKRL
jgi:hypothetical protein